MAVIKRTCWCYIVMMILVSSICKKDKKMMFEIERRLNGDTFPRDFTIKNGEWKKSPSCPSSAGCNAFNGFYSNDGGCRCACGYDFSTFRMGPTPRNSTCIRNSEIRPSEGCTIHFQDDGMYRPLVTLDPSKNGNKIIVTPSGITCSIVGSALYWDYGMWKPIVEDIFSLSSKTLQWKKSTKYSGRIIKQPLTCNSAWNCIMFKIAGKRAYDLNMPRPTKAPTTRSTTRSTRISTTKQPTTKPLTSITTTYPTTPKTTTKQSTTNKQTTLTQTTHKTMSDETTTTERSKHSTHEITTIATEKIPTEASEMPSTEATEQSTTETDVVPGKKGAHGGGSKEGGDNTLVITAISAAAAIACVVIICVFLWCVMKRRQNNRNNEACSTDMTVITNGTGMNNSSAAPTLKNPIYCEPTTKHHPKQLPRLGNPVYDQAVVNNNKKGHQNTAQTRPWHKPSTRNQSNHYDNKDDDKAYDNPGYQDLVIKGGKDTHSADGTYDNTYAEPEKPIYEALSEGNNGRDSIYQPLVHDTQGPETTGSPEYLTLLDENTKPGEQEVPDYLTLVGDENNPTQTETGEYDYAFVDGQEKRSTLDAPSTRGAALQKPQVYNGNGPPLYDVLEDPSDKGPSVYDVLEDPSDKGPPVYDVLEDPQDKGPPVYDVLEGPDLGDDYLVPLEQSNK